MPRVSNPTRPVTPTDSIVSPGGTKRQSPSPSVSFASEEPTQEPEPIRARYEREAEELRHYWQHLIGELRVVDNRLEELGSLLS